MQTKLLIKLHSKNFTTTTNIAIKMLFNVIQTDDTPSMQVK